MVDSVDDLKVQELWALRLLDVERLNSMHKLLENALRFGGDEPGGFAVEVQSWIRDYIAMMDARNSEMEVRHEVLSASVEPNFEVERAHIGRIEIINRIEGEIYPDDGEPFELAGIVRESCYKADFKEWLETRLQGWYIERFGYDDLDVEFLTRVREEIYGMEP